MNDVSYTVLKLANGEDIICEVDYERYDSGPPHHKGYLRFRTPYLWLQPEGLSLMELKKV